MQQWKSSKKEPRTLITDNETFNESFAHLENYHINIDMTSYWLAEHRKGNDIFDPYGIWVTRNKSL